MKRTILTVVFVILLSASIYFLLSTKYSDKNVVLNKEDTVTFTGKISSVKFEACNVSVTSTDGNTYIVGKLSSLGGSENNCIKNPEFSISESGQYLIFEDISGGIDLAIKIFSTETKVLDTLDVLGTSSLLAAEFLYNDKLVIYNGYKGIPDEQWVNVYDIPKIYQDYKNNVTEYGYLEFNDSTLKRLEIKPENASYFEITSDREKLTIYGGTPSSPTIRGSFKIEEL